MLTRFTWNAHAGGTGVDLGQETGRQFVNLSFLDSVHVVKL